jgi:PRC-barrel domain protein
MPSIETVRDWPGRVLVDREGSRVGPIQEIYLDARTDQPEWALVNTGLFGMKSSFVPIVSAQPDGEEVRVPYDKAQIKDAPNVEPDGELSEHEESELYRHYGFDYDEDQGELNPPAPEASGVIADATWPGTTDTPAESPPGTGVPDATSTPAEAAAEPPATTADRVSGPQVAPEADATVPAPSAPRDVDPGSPGVPAPAAPADALADPALPDAQPAAASPVRRRLRRYLVTEYVIRSEEDGREQVVVDRQPVLDDDQAPG